MNLIKAILNATLPLWAVAIITLCIGLLVHVLFQAPEEGPKFATVAKMGIIFEAASRQPNLSEDQVQSAIVKPTLALLKQYEEKGYIVIDTTRDECGNFTIAAIPEQALNLNEELRQILHVK